MIKEILLRISGEDKKRMCLSSRNRGKGLQGASKKSVRIHELTANYKGGGIVPYKVV